MADLILFIMYAINDVILTSLLFQKDNKCFNFLILLDTLFFKVFFFALYDYLERNLDFVS